ncbi:MAG: hypothetical protein CVV48_12965 [Spirochaetae bacterium HGW-Spirochaetae-4]|nr:MAG: hypothetical protein CVV48_12965 [Spirochaetae bacterium HGW-Spirochaetae-4]
MDLNHCFVIQPFDHDKFDARYEEIFVPAIKSAKLEPYRIDEDPSTEIPIDDINLKIRESAIVLADISLDNPNVWFEVGLALAYGKRIVLVCSEERKTPYPFDIQSRSIIRYSTGTKGGFEVLEKDITRKLQSLMAKKNTILLPESEADILSEKSIPDECVIALGVIGGNIQSPSGSVFIGIIHSKMNELGYNNLATNLALRNLERIKYIDNIEESDSFGNNDYYISITEEGYSWIYKNKSRYNLSFEAPKDNREKTSYDNDIPF